LTRDRENPIKAKSHPGINGWLLLLVFGMMLVCITSVAADTYTAGDSNSNGEYQITLIVNPDGSQTLSYAGVVGGTIASQGENPSVEGYQSTESGGGGSGCIVDPVLNQSLDMSGSYGYALLTGKNADGTGAAVETGFTNSDEVLINQQIGTAIRHWKEYATDGGSDESSRIAAYQRVSAPLFGTIYANAYASNADGSIATVSASAQGGQTTWDDSGDKVSEVDSYGYVPSLFQVDQSSRVYGSITKASQDVDIEGVSSASASAFASTSNGDSSFINAWITNGSLTTDYRGGKGGEDYSGYSYGQMSAIALNFNNEFYLTKASGDISTQSQQGGVTSSVTGSYGNSASVDSNWTLKHSCGGSGPFGSWVQSDLEAKTTQTPSVSVITAESEIDHLWGYKVSTTAENSRQFKSKVYHYAWDVDAKAGMVYDENGVILAKWAKIRK
jgi:hypothetical protein